MSEPRITFGIIVLNGEPFTRYALRALYPFAHEIIVVEGAASAAGCISTPGGHSTDGTLEALYEFKEKEDADHKLQIVTRDGFWDEKTEMSRAYAERATGDYLWQVDIDEFYLPSDMRTVIRMLEEDPDITAVSLRTLNFWGDFDYVVDGWYLRRGMNTVFRVFRWGGGYQYSAHRPVTALDREGRDLRRLNVVTGSELARQGIYIYHYSLVFPRLVREKCAYYQEADWVRRPGVLRWVEDNYLSIKKPFRVHNVDTYPSWLMRFRGEHPPEIERMRNDIAEGVLDVELRATDDVEDLLGSLWYRPAAFIVRLLDPVARFPRWLYDILASITPGPIKRPIKKLLRRGE